MATNRSARKTIINNYNMLLNIRDKTPGITPVQQADIQASLYALDEEYLAVAGVNPNATYAEITNALTNAKTNLTQIREDRQKLKNAMTSAQKIFNAIGAVLKLIS